MFGDIGWLPPFRYLGCPTVYGRGRAKLFIPLIDKIKGKISGWHNNILSLEGKLIMLKHELSSIPMHILAVCDLPKKVIKVIEKLFVIFFWGSKDGKGHEGLG